jgi:hypothetical protein
MISIVHNETVKAVEIYLDHKGVDVLIEKLQELKSSGNHLHLYVTNDERGLSAKSPYGESVVMRNSSSICFLPKHGRTATGSFPAAGLSARTTHHPSSMETRAEMILPKSLMGNPR